MTKLNKAIIPIAGLGTRMLPATKAIPKEMLPVAGKPIIQHIVEEIKEAGFNEIAFVTHSSKYSIENHFDKSFELEATLDKRIKRSLLKEIKNISKIGISIHSVRQGEAKGLGHAVLCAKKFVGNDPFAIILPDMLLQSSNRKKNLVQMKKDFEKNQISSILFAKADKKDIPNYGIAKIKRNKESIDLGKVEAIIEKPSLQKAPSNLFAVGRYIFKSELMNVLSKTKPDLKNEIQLTKAIDSYIKNNELVEGYALDGKVHDCGNKLGYLIANIEYSKFDPQIGNDLRKYLNKNV
ncbi:UTP--glucose-1-phosphate uridylyltransferase [Gammaproteobacteria bacterium]|nr:UTP--glucose-1-phosphate uridylyltransferase [Gammaproteobacteria bacterium]